MEPRLDHVGVLVSDVARAAAALADLGHAVGSAEEFPAEGTREIYAGEPHQAGRLLLLQPIGPGPYADALEMRGVGLHHIAIATSSVEDFVKQVGGTGWYLHPRSLETFQAARMVWLTRPGVPTLIEVFEGDASNQANEAPVVSRIELPASTYRPRLLDALGIAAIVASADGGVWLTLGGRRIDPAALGR